MTAKDFIGSMHEVPLTSTYRDEALHRLSSAEARMRAAIGRSPSIVVMARCDLDNAIAIAEEWGVVGKRGAL